MLFAAGAVADSQPRLSCTTGLPTLPQATSQVSPRFPCEAPTALCLMSVAICCGTVHEYLVTGMWFQQSQEKALSSENLIAASIYTFRGSSVVTTTINSKIVSDCQRMWISYDGRLFSSAFFPCARNIYIFMITTPCRTVLFSEE